MSRKRVRDANSDARRGTAENDNRNQFELHDEEDYFGLGSTSGPDRDAPPHPSNWNGETLPYKPKNDYTLLFHYAPDNTMVIHVPNSRGEHSNLPPGVDYYELANSNEVIPQPIAQMKNPTNDVATQVNWYDLVPPLDPYRYFAPVLHQEGRRIRELFKAGKGGTVEPLEVDPLTSEHYRVYVAQGRGRQGQR